MRQPVPVLSPLTLSNQVVLLEPLAPTHSAELADAAAGDRSSYGYTWVPDGREEVERYVDLALEQHASGRAMPHVVRTRADGRVVGTTRFLDMDVFTWPGPWPPGVGGPEPADDLPPTVLEIGSTWYAASAQRTGVNLHAKFLQLTHAFEVWEVLRVSLKTDARNLASRTAIERLGAQAEGVRRAHVPATDGTVRDSAFYSIVATEWPGVRDRLRRRLDRHS